MKQACNGFRTFGVLGLPPGVSFPRTPHMTGHAVRSLSYIPSRKRKEEKEMDVRVHACMYEKVTAVLLLA